jgi:hypothetical protein
MCSQASLRGGGVEDTRRCHQLVTPRWSLESDITRPPPFSVVSRVSQSLQQCPLLLLAETPFVPRQHEQQFHTDEIDQCRNPSFCRLCRNVICRRSAVSALVYRRDLLTHSGGFRFARMGSAVSGVRRCIVAFQFSYFPLLANGTRASRCFLSHSRGRNDGHAIEVFRKAVAPNRRIGKR